MQHTLEERIGVKLVFYRTLLSQSAASLTMGSLSAYLRQSNIPVELCLLESDAPDNSWCIARNSEDHPLIIAKPNFKDFREMFPLLKSFKQINVQKKVYLCGPYASINARNIMENCPWLDGIIQGEAEETCLELILLHSGGGTVHQVPGGVWRIPEEGTILQTEKRKVKLSLDALPFPARDIEQMEQGSYINIEAMRGCLYKCSFCHVPLAHEQSISELIRTRDPKKVVDEIEHLNKTLGKSLFIFNDPIFWAGPQDDKRILEFCKEIKSKDLDIHYYAYLRCRPWPDETVLNAMTKAGLVRVFLGVENSSEQTLSVYNKHIKNKDFEIVKRSLDKRDVNIHIGYITFQPYSTLQEISGSINFLHSLNKLFRLGVILEPVRIIPGLALHRQLINSKLMKEGLNHDEVTYGYKYNHPEVGELHSYIKSTFNDVGHQAYVFEYHATTGYLARTLAKRINPGVENRWMPEFVEFDNLVHRANDRLLNFFDEAINCTRKKVEYDSSEFVEEFLDTSLQVSAAWVDLKESITTSVGSRVFREIYPSLERP